MTVLDNLTDSDGINALDNLSFLLLQSIYRPNLPATMLLTDIVLQPLERIISVFHLPTFNTQQDFLMIPMELSNSPMPVITSALLVIIPSHLGERKFR